jgi:DNA-binding MarR family transcriptional regulator
MNNESATAVPSAIPSAADSASHWTVSVLHAARVIEDRMELALGKVSLSMAKQGALTQLALAGEPLTLSQLATRLSCVRSNMTQLIDRLEADGLVRRLDDPADRRSVRAELTALGRQRQDAGARAMAKVQAEIAAGLSKADRSALESALSAFK